MNTRMLSIVEGERKARLAHLGGTHIEASIPVTQRLVNVLVARAAAERNLAGLTVTLRGGSEIRIEVLKPVFGFQARVAIDLRIRGPVDLSVDPRVYLIVVRPSFTWSTVSRVAVAAGLAPRGVEVGRDGVAVDLRVLADGAGVGDLLQVVRTIGFDGDTGVLRVHVVADVPEGGIERANNQGWTRGTPRNQGPPTLPLDVAIAELRGGRVWGRIAVAEELANEVIGVALEAARNTARTDGAAAGARGSTGTAAPLLDRGAIARWVQHASVRFENGRAVFEPDVVIG